MTWKIEHLATSTDDELVGYARQESPTLRRMHSIDQLCTRSLTNRSLLDTAIESVINSLGHSDRLGGLPVGYLGAATLHRHGGDEWKRLLAALVRVEDQERGDLLRWLNPDHHAQAESPEGIDEERELVFGSPLESSTIGEAISRVLGCSASVLVEAIISDDEARTIGFITLPLALWRDLEKKRGDLSRALDTAVYWDFSEQYGDLGPDVRVAVLPDCTEELVVATPTAAGYTVEPLHGDARGRVS